jgi:hypothetical protein|tara:strand:+ start:5444 stop:5638 length:195 start_codon:yes stop_codon:yes gene_type:complete
MSKALWDDAYIGKHTELTDSGLSDDDIEREATKWANEASEREQEYADHIQEMNIYQRILTVRES